VISADLVEHSDSLGLIRGVEFYDCETVGFSRRTHFHKVILNKELGKMDTIM
jgi:hypothetical protein